MNKVWAKNIKSYGAEVILEVDGTNFEKFHWLRHKQSFYMVLDLVPKLTLGAEVHLKPSYSDQTPKTPTPVMLHQSPLVHFGTVTAVFLEFLDTKNFHLFLFGSCLLESMIFILLPFLTNALNVTGHGRTDIKGRYWDTTYDCKGKNVK